MVLLFLICRLMSLLPTVSTQLYAGRALERCTDRCVSEDRRCFSLVVHGPQSMAVTNDRLL